MGKLTGLLYSDTIVYTIRLPLSKKGNGKSTVVYSLWHTHLADQGWNC